MPRRNVRVDFPLRNHLKMITLVEAIFARYAELGSPSPLDDPIIDMTSYAAQHTLHKDEYDASNDLHGKGQAATEEADIALGTNEGQTIDTPGTIYYHVGRIRKRLSLACEGKEEQITTFGFSVVEEVVKGRKTIRIDIPINQYLKMTQLVDKIFARHAELGGTSPLDSPEIDLTELDTLHATHQTKRTEAAAFHAKGEAAMQAANIALGIAKAQTVKIVGTVYNITARIRDHLLIAHQNFEEELSTYGFNVVISMTPLPGEGGPEVIEGNIVADETLGIFDELEDTTALTLENTGTVPLTFCRMEDEVSACDPVANITVNPGDSTTATGTDLGATGNWLNVTNADPATVGAFRVTIE